MKENYNKRDEYNAGITRIKREVLPRKKKRF
jgi:hypothetical protein